jgi:hypothetical protein
MCKKRPDGGYRIERYTREPLVTCLGSFVTPVGEPDKLVFERQGAGQVSWSYVGKMLEDKEMESINDTDIVRWRSGTATHNPREDEEDTLDLRDAKDMYIAKDQQLEYDEPLAHLPVKTAVTPATPHDVCIKRRLFCMRPDLESMDRHFVDESLTTITLV